MKKVCFLLLIFSLSSWANSKTNPVNKESKKDVKTNYKLPKKVLEELNQFLKILNKKSTLSNDYKQTVTFLKGRFYNNAHFNTLEILADTYKNNGDYSNQIKVLNILIADYPKNPKSHYKLGMAYKNLFLKNHKKEDKQKSIDNLSNAIKINRKYEPAYKELLPLLLKGDVHTKNSLSLVMEMIRYVKKPEHFIYLCKAYFDNKYWKQSQRACKKAMIKNPGNPKSHILYILSKKVSKDTNKKIIDIAEKYKKSFYVQFRTGIFFMKTNQTLATSYLNSALKINPESLKILKILSKLLFKQGQFKKSYNHFLKACILSKGSLMLEFQKATSQISHKDASLSPLFKKGVEKCFNSLKSKKN